MNWIVFALVAWITLGLELGLRPGLALGHSGVAPSFAITLLAFVCLSAPRPQALWASVIIGVALDLTARPLARGGLETITAPGPHALGCLLAGALILNMRATLMHRNALAIAFVAALASLVASIVVVACFALRSWYDPAVDVSPTGELWARLGVAVYTGALALVLAPALRAITPLFGFMGQHGRTGRTQRR